MTQNYTSIGAIAVFILFSLSAFSQNFIDKYLTDPLVYTTIGNSTQQVNLPKDLDFKPNTNELWVGNYGTTSGGSVVIFYNAGETNQTFQYRKDSHSSHFMRFTSAIAMGDNGEWANTSEIQNTSSPTSTFMGPSLWTSDTNIFAKVFQNAWVNGLPLGSHLDMLHQSPFAMGIAHDSAKQYWVFDGHNGNLCKYDYVIDHSPGYDNHSAGKIWRYTDITLTRTPGIPGHMVLDKNTGWLYIVDTGTNRLIRVNTNTGTVVGPLTVPSTANEPLAGYWAVNGAVVEVVATYTSQHCGVDHFNDRLVVTDYSNGNIHIYNTSTPSPTLLGTITTGQPGIMGVKIGPDGKIWYVNNTLNRVVRIDPLPATIDASISAITSPVLENYESRFYSPLFNQCIGTLTPSVTLKNSGTATLTSVVINYSVDGGPATSFNWTGSLASGTSTSVTLPGSSLANGNHKLKVYTSLPNGSPDQNTMNDTKEGSFRSLNPVVSYPYLEDFTPAVFPPAGAFYIGYNKYCFMSRIATVGGFGVGLGCLKMDNFSGAVNISGQKDYFLLPRINMSTAPPGAKLEFDVAYRRYDNTSVDQLEVFVSIDCGLTWTSVYNKSGSVLATAPNGTSAFVPSATQWRKDVVSMTPYAGQPEILIQFVSTSDWGNHFYVDNISLYHTVGWEEQEVGLNVNVYPNPSSGVFTVTNDSKISTIEISDVSGRLVLSKNVNAVTTDFDLTEHAKGIYFVKVKSGDKSTVKRVEVQ